MDGSSYAGITQLMTAAEQPPALRCIIPAVVSTHPFLHVPRWGGGFARQHTLGWTQIISVDSLTELTPGFWGTAALLTSPTAWKRLLGRPAINAADDMLREDGLRHYRDAISHEVFDEYHHVRTLSDQDFARIRVPTMMITGLFDTTMGTQYAWHELEKHGPTDAERTLLIGPWDHGQSYVGGGRTHGPWDFGTGADFDLPAARLAFFDRHLKGKGSGPKLNGRVSAFVNGANSWMGMDRYPTPGQGGIKLFLHSDGFANMRDHGVLSANPPRDASAPSDHFQTDPMLPFVPVAATLDPALSLDLRETERLEDVLTYTTEPLVQPVTLFGEFEVRLHVAADTPDCDIVCWLAIVPPDGRTTQLSWGLLRLRYREGFDRIALLKPGVPEHVTIPMHHVAHHVPSGCRLRLLIAGGCFPLIDPNPNTGEPIATAIETRTTRQTVFHDASKQSHVLLPVLSAKDAFQP